MSGFGLEFGASLGSGPAPNSNTKNESNSINILLCCVVEMLYKLLRTESINFGHQTLDPTGPST